MAMPRTRRTRTRTTIRCAATWCTSTWPRTRRARSKSSISTATAAASARPRPRCWSSISTEDGRRNQAIHRQGHAAAVRRQADPQSAEMLPAVLAGAASRDLFARAEATASREPEADSRPRERGQGRSMSTLDAAYCRSIPRRCAPIFRSSRCGCTTTCRWSISTSRHHAAAAAGDPIAGRRLRKALRQRPSRHSLAERSEHRPVRRSPREGPRLHQCPSARRGDLHPRHDRRDQPGRPQLGRLRNITRGRRNAAHRDGAPLQSRPLAAAGRTERRRAAAYPHHRRRPACNSTGCRSC